MFAIRSHIPTLRVNIPTLRVNIDVCYQESHTYFEGEYLCLL